MKKPKKCRRFVWYYDGEIQHICGHVPPNHEGTYGTFDGVPEGSVLCDIIPVLPRTRKGRKR